MDFAKYIVFMALLIDFLTVNNGSHSQQNAMLYAAFGVLQNASILVDKVVNP